MWWWPIMAWAATLCRMDLSNDLSIEDALTRTATGPCYTFAQGHGCFMLSREHEAYFLNQEWLGVKSAEGWRFQKRHSLGRYGKTLTCVERALSQKNINVGQCQQKKGLRRCVIQLDRHAQLSVYQSIHDRSKWVSEYRQYQKLERSLWQLNEAEHRVPIPCHLPGA